MIEAEYSPQKSSLGFKAQNRAAAARNSPSSITCGGDEQTGGENRNRLFGDAMLGTEFRSGSICSNWIV